MAGLQAGADPGLLVLDHERVIDESISVVPKKAAGVEKRAVPGTNDESVPGVAISRKVWADPKEWILVGRHIFPFGWNHPKNSIVTDSDRIRRWPRQQYPRPDWTGGAR